MTDPDRLSTRDRGLRGQLLRSARGDAPSKVAWYRTAKALGVAGGLAAASTTTAASASTSKLAAYGGAGVLLKSIGIGAISGVVALGTVEVMHARAPRQPVASPASSLVGSGHIVAPASHPVPVAAIIPSVGPGPPSAAPTLDEEAPPPSRTKAPPPPPAVPVPARAAAPAVPETTTSALTDELRSLDRASARLAAGDASGALAALDDHDRAWRGGALTPEAAVLRIEALASLGSYAEATMRANAFLVGNPGSAQARRVRSVLSQIEARTKP